MGTLWLDLRYAVRLLLKTPGLTVAAVTILALGIGIPTAILSWAGPDIGRLHHVGPGFLGAQPVVGWHVVGADAHSGAARVRIDEVRIDARYRSMLLTIPGTLAFVLLVAGALMSGRFPRHATGRQREVAIRLALGARRSRVARQLLTERVVLVLAGGSGGLLVAFAGVILLRRGFLPVGSLPDRVAVDFRVLGCALGSALLLEALHGLIPALQSPTAVLHETRHIPDPALRFAAVPRDSGPATPC